MKKRVYKKGSLKRNKDGNIVGAVKGHYIVKEVNTNAVNCNSVMKYVFQIGCGIIVTYGILELCGRIGHF